MIKIEYRRISLNNRELAETLSVCTLTIKQINNVFNVKKAANKFKKNAVIQRENLQLNPVGRPTKFLFVKPNGLTLQGIKKGDQLEAFVRFLKSNGLLLANFKQIAGNSLSVDIFDFRRQRIFEGVRVHFLIGNSFKNIIPNSRSNIYLVQSFNGLENFDFKESDLVFRVDSGSINTNFGFDMFDRPIGKSVELVELGNFLKVKKTDFKTEFDHIFKEIFEDVRG